LFGGICNVPIRVPLNLANNFSMPIWHAHTRVLLHRVKTPWKKWADQIDPALERQDILCGSDQKLAALSLLLK
jgi:hypothetical protein